MLGLSDSIRSKIATIYVVFMALALKMSITFLRFLDVRELPATMQPSNAFSANEPSSENILSGYRRSSRDIRQGRVVHYTGDVIPHI